MIKRYYLLFVCFFLAFVTKAQVNYNFSATTGTYTSILGTGTNPVLVSPDPGYTVSDEGYANSVPIGFNFVYNGALYSSVNINANGYLTLGAGFIPDPNESYYYDSLAGGPVSLPGARPIIAPFWADMDLRVATNLTYTVSGTSPNRIFTVEWSSALWDYTATTASISFQAKLYETTNVIDFIYKQEAGSPSGDRVGIGLTGTGSGAGNFLSLSSASAAPTASSTVETKIFNRPATGQVYRFTPLVCLPPTNLVLTNVTATSATISWAAVSGAGGYEYIVSTSNIPPTTAGISTSSASVNLSGLSAGVNYVYVRTNCGGGLFSLWAVKAIVPCTTNGSPANGATNVSIPPTISWNAIAGATGYTIMFSLDGITYANLGSVSNSLTSTPVPGTSPNTTYYWYIRPEGGNDTASQTCSSNAFSFTTAAGLSNDDICNAIPLILNGPSDCQTTELATVEAIEPTFGCSAPNNTLWYTYTPTTDGPITIVMSVNASATTNLDAWVPLFTASGSCPGIALTEAFPGTCDEADLTTVDSVEIVTNSLVAGTTYYIMVDGFAGATGGYCIHIKDAAPLPAGPVNDTICNAIPLTLNGPSDCQTTVSATIEASEPAFGCSTPNNTVWYTYTPTVDGPVKITMNTNPGATTNLDAWVSLFTATGSCPSLTLTEAFAGTCNEADLTTVDSVEIITGSLVAGTTYYIMIDGFSGAVGGFCINVSNAPIAPSCTVLLLPTDLATNVSAPIAPLTWNSVSGADGYDVALGTTNPPPTLGNTVDTTVNITGLAYATTYYWTVYPTNGGVAATGCTVFSFTTGPAPAGPVNDDVCNAIVLTLNGPSDCQTTETATVEATEPTFGCSTPNNTTWYTYTPTVSGPATIVMGVNAAATTNLDAWVSLFTATGSCPTLTLTEEFPGTCDEADLTTIDSVEIITGNLVAGTTYYIMVDGFAGAVGGYCIHIKYAAPLPAGPVNDTICNAIPLTLNGPSDCQTTESATIEASEPAFGCSTPNNTTWYTYTPTTSGPVSIVMGVNAAAAVNLDAWVSLFTATGSCPTLTLTEEFPGTCNEADLTTIDSVEIVSGSLVAGTTYYIMVDGFAGATGGYCIHIKDAPIAPPCTVLLSPADVATNVSAPVAPLTWASVVGADGYDVALGTVNPPGVLGNTPDTTVNITGLAFNTTYYWSVTPTNAAVPATGCTTVFSFTTGSAPAPPPNDPCTGAIGLTAGVPVPGTTISATESLPANACNGFTGNANDDVWYSITAIYNGDATITLTPDVNFDAVMEAFTGSCSGTLTSIGCADATIGGQPETLTLSGLTVGQVVYIRVFDYGAAGSEGTFTIMADGSALPVRLVDFKGERIGAKNQLSWSTASEQNNRGFELQRSADAENYSTLTFVQSKAVNGNSSSALSYQFADEKPFAGNSYYRLKQVDFDGKSTYSNIVLIKGVRTSAITMSAVYPNPVREILKVILSAPNNNTVRLIVTDVAGKVVLQKAADVIMGDNNLSVNVGNLPSGSYMIKAVCANGCETTVSKFVKQ